MRPWRRVTAADEFAAQRADAVERLRARRRRADGFDTPLRELPAGEIWVHDTEPELTVWLLPGHDRVNIADITGGVLSAQSTWSELVALAAAQGWPGQMIFSTFRGDGELGELPAVSAASRVATKMQQRAEAVAPPIVATRAMTDAEFAAYAARSVNGYAQELLASGAAVDADAARAEASESHARLLPQGLATPGQCFWTILDQHDRPVGLLWIHLQEHQAYIYDIEMRPEARGRGFGTQTLRFAAAQAREAGVEVVALNVFAHNDDARRLYAREGFVETEVAWSAVTQT